MPRWCAQGLPLKLVELSREDLRSVGRLLNVLRDAPRAVHPVL